LLFAPAAAAVSLMLIDYFAIFSCLPLRHFADTFFAFACAFAAFRHAARGRYAYAIAAAAISPHAFVAATLR